MLFVSDSGGLHVQTCGTDAVDRDEVAVRGEGLNVATRVADRIDEEFGLLRDAGKFAFDNHAAQFHDGVTDGNDADGLLAVLLVQLGRLSLQLRAPFVDGRLQESNWRVIALSVVGDPLLAGRDIVRIPRGLQEQSQVGIVLQSQLGEFRDPFVRDHDVWSHREEIDFAADECLLGLVLRLFQVPMLDDARAADPLLASELVPLNARRFHELLDPLRHKHMEAVPGVEDPQPSGSCWGRGGLSWLLLSNGKVIGKQRQARQRQRGAASNQRWVVTKRSHSDLRVGGQQAVRRAARRNVPVGWALLPVPA